MASAIPFRRKIVRFLASDIAQQLEGIRESEWTRNLRWLDRSGLALPLAARVASLAPDLLPAAARQALSTRLRDNAARMQYMLEFFDTANRALAESGVRYCCVKGFSLVPDCFNGIAERHQVDLDFLIDPRDAQRARRAIEAIGYSLQRDSDSGELRFTRPWKNHLGIGAYLYQLPEPPPIEVHTRVWEPEAEGIGLPSPADFFAAIEIHHLAGLQFPRLSPAQQFVYLLLHIFRHLLGSWTRLLSLYEVAAFIRARQSDEALWMEVYEIVSAEETLASACALVLALVCNVFPFASLHVLPRPLRMLSAQSLSAESAVWIERYSVACLFTDPPGNKLALLVQEQFVSNRDAWRKYLLQRLLPLRKAHALSDHAAKSTRRSIAYRAENFYYKASRVWYHLRSGLGYLLARLRWQRLRQAPATVVQTMIRSSTQRIGSER